MKRREFLWMAAGTSGAAVLGGCRTASVRDNAALRAAVDGYVAEGLYLGLACASNRGDLYVKGKRTLDEPRLPVTADTLFDLASVGKTHTAALCALLYADGRLDVDAPFTKYLPEHVLAKENCRITVRDLATHSGGFDNSKPYMTPDAKKMFAELYRKRPVWPRGTRFCYACSNFVYLGLIVERLTGMDLDAAAKKMLWGPLGMKRTTWQTVVGDPTSRSIRRLRTAANVRGRGSGGSASATTRARTSRRVRWATARTSPRCPTCSFSRPTSSAANASPRRTTTCCSRRPSTGTGTGAASAGT